MKYFFSLLTPLLILNFCNAQYDFKITKEISCTPVKNQNRTGTCWSFATSSFIESEIIKKQNKLVDLSEMFIVRKIYEDKAKNYVLRQGKANFSQGSLAHDLINMVDEYGIIPESIFSGLTQNDTIHNHSEMEAGLKGFLDGIIKQKKLSTKWDEAFAAILDVYLGVVPNQFDFENRNYNSKSFKEEIGISKSDYTSLTSFSHHPFYNDFILEIPDNYSNGSFYNLPLDELMETIDFAIVSGYTVAWDGDVSEKSFSAEKGIAVLPQDGTREDLFDNPGPELTVTQLSRQNAFERYLTTDDHLMHIMGIALDQNGTKYYVVKNSWGEISPFRGYIFMSEAYVKMKTVGILLNKNAIPLSIKNNLE